MHAGRWVYVDLCMEQYVWVCCFYVSAPVCSKLLPNLIIAFFFFVLLNYIFPHRPFVMPIKRWLFCTFGI